MKWKESLPGDSEIVILREDSLYNVEFIFSIDGNKVDPFSVNTTLIESKSPNCIVDKLLSGVGFELKYSYKRSKTPKSGKNILHLKLPKTNHENILFYRTLIALAIPIALQCVIENIAISIDTFMLGFIESNSMSAVALASQFNTINIFFVSAIVVVESMLLAQFWGKRDRISMQYTFGICIKVGYALSSLFFIVAMFFSKQILSFYTDVPELIEKGSLYLKYISFSYLLIPFIKVNYCLMKTIGKVTSTLIFALLGCLLNVILNAILIFGLFGIEPMGIKGAAITTVMSNILQVILVFAYSKIKSISIIKSSKELDIKEKKQILRIIISKILPVLIQYAVYLIGINAISSALGHMGPDVIAANALIASVSAVFLSIKDGIGSGTGILIGANLGKNDTEAAWQNSQVAFKLTFKIGVVVSAMISLILVLLRFTPIKLSERALYLMSFQIIAYFINNIFGFLNAVACIGCLYPGGDTIAVLIIDALVMGTFIVPISLLGIFTDIIPVVLLMMLLQMNETLSFPLKYLRVKKKIWLKNITVTHNTIYEEKK